MKTILVAIAVLTFSGTSNLHAQQRSTEEYILCDGSTLEPGLSYRTCKAQGQGTITSVKQVYQFPPGWQLNVRPDDCVAANPANNIKGTYKIEAGKLMAWSGCNGGFVVDVRGASTQTIRKNVGCPTQNYDENGHFTCPMNLAHNNNQIIPNTIRVTRGTEYSHGKCSIGPVTNNPNDSNNTWFFNLNDKSITVRNGCYASFTVEYLIRVP